MPTAVIVPQTALLVPGVAGRSEVLTAVRTAALAASRELVAERPARVVLLAPAAENRAAPADELCTSLVGLGVPEHAVGWPAPCGLAGCPAHESSPPHGARAGVAAAVGLRLLAAAGVTSPVSVVELAPGEPSAGASELASRADALLVLGSLSARHGERAPRAADPRAPEVDARLVADLAAASPEAIDRLASFDPGLAEQLDVGGAATFALLARVAGRPTNAELLARDDSLGVAHLVARWRWAA